MAYSDSNRYVSEIRRGNGEEKEIPVQDREKDSTSRQSIGTSDVWETNNKYVPNTNKRNVQTGCERQWGVCEEHKKKGTSDNATSIYETLSNSNTGFSIRENEEIQSRGNATTNGSEDVSNSDTNLRGGRGTEFQSRDDGQWRFYSEKEKQTRDDIRSKIIGCDAVLGKEKTNKTWWQTQSEFCGVPDGVSFELDKDRSGRIKSLGNSIVPQIARQLGLSIMEAELNG